MRPCILLAFVVLVTGCQSLDPQVVGAWQRFKTIEPGMTREQVHGVVGPKPGRECSEFWIVGAVEEGQRVEMTVQYDEEDRVAAVERHRYGFGLSRIKLVKTDMVH